MIDTNEENFPEAENLSAGFVVDDPQIGFVVGFHHIHPVNLAANRDILSRGQAESVFRYIGTDIQLAVSDVEVALRQLPDYVR